MGIDHIDYFEYHESGNVLTVAFKSGAVYDYHPVNPEAYAELIRANSLNRAINRLIRDGRTVGIKRVVGN